MQPRVRLEPATPDELLQIAEWLEAPEIWADAFLLPTEPDPPWVMAGMLMVKQGIRLELVQARFWSIRDEGDRKLLGFAIDYGWDTADDTIREIDIALPNGGHEGRRIIDLFGKLLRAMFERGASEVRCRVRGRGFDRLFARIGAVPVQVVAERHPKTSEDVVRAHYRCTPDLFYASRYWRNTEQGSLR
jgi:hypothetical protein